MKQSPFNQDTPIRVGFSQSPFPVVEGSLTNTETFQLKCRGFDVEVDVSLCKLSMDDIQFTGIVSSAVSISHKLPLGGFASHCHIDEGETMRESIDLYCENNNLTLCGTYNNWPSFRGSVNKN